MFDAARMPSSTKTSMTDLSRKTRSVTVCCPGASGYVISIPPTYIALPSYPMVTPSCPSLDRRTRIPQNAESPGSIRAVISSVSPRMSVTFDSLRNPTSRSA